MIELLNMDCMDYLRDCDDNEFDLAIVDPPYGIGQDWKKNKASVHYKHETQYKNNSIPEEQYFKELFRVSRNQIIWGANYYTEFLRPINSWIIWDKKRNVDKTFMSEGEMAWTSFKKPMRFYRHQWDGAKKGQDTGLKKQHPHQKPVDLYNWILTNYVKPGQRILDTHLGSGSSAIAAHYFGCDFVGIELDEDYFKAAQERFNNETRQEALF